MTNEETITVRLKRSTIGETQRQKACVRGLGLKRVDSVKVLQNTPSVRGMIKQVIHLLDVQEGVKSC